MNKNKRQNIGSRMREFGTNSKSLSGHGWCLYLNFDFDEQRKNDPLALQPGDRYYDFEEKQWKIK